MGGILREYKKCYVCCVSKPISEFSFIKKRNKYLGKCKDCRNEYERNYRSKNREKYRKINKEQYEKNKEKRIEDSKKYREENKEKVNKKRRDNYYKKIKNDKLYKLKRRIRVCLWHSFYRNGYRKNKKINEMLGCNLDYFCNYLLETFKNNYGYEWDNKEPVHIDHIKPLATAMSEQEIIELCHYTNLQLLKEKDNLRKGAKILTKI